MNFSIKYPLGFSRERLNTLNNLLKVNSSSYINEKFVSLEKLSIILLKFSHTE